MERLLEALELVFPAVFEATVDAPAPAATFP